MPAVLTHKAIALMARDRLAHLSDITRRRIERKRLAGETPSHAELKINALARDAFNMMSAQPLADNRTTRQRRGPVVGSPDLFRSVSKFAIMGSMGPDLPAFAEVFRPGQGWIFDTIHKGTPDYNREAVIARTTDMALSFHRRAATKVRETTRNRDISIQERDEIREMNKVKAYVMGHLCHVAADVISHPFINDLEWHQAIPGSKHASHGKNEAQIDAAVAKKFFRRPRTKGGQGWAGWWPGEDEIKPYFFEAYSEAFEEIYGEERQKSFKEFEDELIKREPPEMTPEFMRYGYKTFRGFGLGFAYGWGYWDWFGMLTPLIVPMLFAPILMHALPHGRELFDLPDQALSERANFELLQTPVGYGALTSLIIGGMLMPFARGAETHAILGLVTQSYTIASTITTWIEAAEVDNPEDGIPDGVRWFFFFVVPVFMGVVFTGETIADSVEDWEHDRPFGESPAERRALLSLVNLAPLIPLVLVGILIAIFLGVRSTEEGESTVGLGKPHFWITAGIWMALMLAAWFLVPIALRSIKIPEHSDDDDFPLKPHGVRLFDDQTLFTDPEAEEGTSAKYYPSDLRPLAKLWWEGDGSMQIRSDRFGLTFQHDASGAEPQTVPGPMVPMTMAEYLQFLRETVVDGAGTAGGLRGSVFSDEAIANYTLPTGAVFAAHGDFSEGASESDVNSGAAEFKDLGATEEASEYLLYHAPKPYQAIHMAPDGAFRGDTEAARRAVEAERGYAYVVDAVNEDPRLSDAVMSKAADLGALLCMGAADHMNDTPAGTDRVYQVFRNWSLDRRRINEWRMLVEGGAHSDKSQGADRYDPAMPRDLYGPADPETWQAPMGTATDPTALEEAEETARGFGWIPTLREYVRIVEEDADLFDADIDPVRPNVPPNRAITRAMAWLVDAADPMEG